MYCLITGSSGFLGSHLVKALKKLGYDVVTIKHNLLTNLKDLKVFFKYHQQIDYIFNLASYGNHYHQKNEKLMLQANVNNLKNLLEVTKNINYKAFVNFSSSSVYGIKDKPMVEEMELKPITFYGVTKMEGEIICNDYFKKYNKPVVNVRPFSCYGIGEADFRFIPTVIYCLKSGQTLDLSVGYHDWIYISDIISGVLKAVDNIDKLSGQSINIGTGRQYSNEDVVNSLIKISGKKLNINYLAKKREYDTTNCWLADNNKLKSLGWSPKVSLKEGLKKVWDYYE